MRHRPWRCGSRLRPLAACMALLGSWASATGAADAPYAPDTPEPGSIEAIRQYTTSDAYLPESVAYVPDSDTVPSPTEFLGHLVGAPRELTRVEKIHAYFQSLAEKSPRVRADVIGQTEEGRDILRVLVSDAATLDNLPRQREITRRLADPRKTPREAMTSLVLEGKVAYYLLGGLHSTETGSPEMLMELAYRLAVSERPEIREIRDNVLVMITPVCEPDGRDRIVDWYYRHLRDRTDLSYDELRQFSSPPYWGHYAFHDNNRDGMQLTLALTRAIHGQFYAFHPQVVHDLHESLPLLYISTGHGPYSDAIDPVTINEWTQFAHHEAGALQAQGLPGVWTWGFWDGWWPGYLFSVANNHNSVGRFYETFGNSLAGTFRRNLEERKFVGKPVTEEQWYRPWPPDKKVDWSLRNNTNYMQAGVLEALRYAALHREELLRNAWVKAERALHKGETEAPYAWIFPEDQRDPNRLAALVNQLQAHHIEVDRLRRPATYGERTFPAGSYVVRCNQPYRNAIVNFLQKQKFPANEPNPPYDDVAWTWPLLQGVEAVAIDDAKVLETPVVPVRDEVRHAGTVSGEGPVFLLADTGQNALLAARVRLGKRTTVEAAEAAFEVEGRTYPPGSWIVRGPEDRVAQVARDLGLDVQRVAEAPDVTRHVVDLPRLAVLHTWTATQDCGWVRYTLDRDEIPYTLINPDDLKRGRLEGRFDVILFPNTWGNFRRIVHGIDPKYGPLAYTRTAEYPSHGAVDASDDITGGMGFAGVIHLQRFVESGGVLLAVGNAGRLPVEGGIVRHVDETSVGRTPGSEVRATFTRPQHPVAYGYEPETSVFRGNMALFDVDERHRDLVVLQFGTKKVEQEPPAYDQAAVGPEAGAVGTEVAAAAGSAATTEGTSAEGESENETEAGADKTAKPLVLSGWVKDPKKLDGKPAILDVPVGEGRVILYGFNPMHRYLNTSDFRLVYNAILNWNDLPDGNGAVRAVSRKR